MLAIDDQLADLQTSARVVAVRVATGADTNGTIANIVGSRQLQNAAGQTGTGIYALLRAGTILGVIPRLIGAPGFTGTTNLAVNTVTITGGANAGGSGFTTPPTVTFGPTGSGIITATGHSVLTAAGRPAISTATTAPRRPPAAPRWS